MRVKDMVQRIEAEMARHPDTTYIFEKRGKHPAVRVFHGDNSRFLVFSGTPTTACGVKNNISKLRRTLAGLKQS